MDQMVEAAAPCGGELALVTIDRRPTGFLDLPYELRVQIYRLCLPQRRLFDVSPFLGPSYKIDSEGNALYDDRYHDWLGDESPRRYGNGNTGPFSINYWDDWDNGVEYKYDDYNPRFDSWPTSVLPTLLQVSRQVSDEALDVLYGDNAFKTVIDWCEEDYLRSTFTEANRRRIRHFMLVLRPGGWYPDHRMDAAIWDDILPYLRTLWLMADHSWVKERSGWVNTLEERLKDWTEWLTPVLEFLAKRLSTETSVLVDVDEGDETDKLLQQYLTHAYRRMRRKPDWWAKRRGEIDIRLTCIDIDYDDVSRWCRGRVTALDAIEDASEGVVGKAGQWDPWAGEAAGWRDGWDESWGDGSI